MTFSIFFIGNPKNHLKTQNNHFNKMSTDLTTSEPQVQQLPEWADASYPPLRKDNVGRAAVNGQLIPYPKVVRGSSDPLPRGQDGTHSNFSFMILDEPKVTKEGGKIYGFGIIRGHHKTHQLACDDAERLIRTHDSKNQVLVVPNGEWFCLTSDPNYYSEQKNVDVTKSKEEDEELKKSQAKRIAEQQRITREIKEREEAIRNSKDIRENPKSLDYYTMRRVTLNSLIDERENLTNRLESVKTIMTKVMKELNELEKTNPEYIDQWVDRYNVDRLKVSCPAYVPSDKEIELYQKLKTDLLENSSKQETLDEDSGSSSQEASSSDV